MKFSWKLDDFDSKIFGFKVAKVINAEPQEIDNLIKDLLDKGIGYAVYRVQSDNFPVIHALERTGFILVDGLVTLKTNVLDIKKEKYPIEIREASSKDLADLKKLTLNLYSISRIFNDPLISRSKANEFFLRWIENSILKKVADATLIWQENNEILGYVTLQKKGQIPLLGVSNKARGRGIAKKLIRYSLNKFKEWGVEKVIIETQMINIPALRVYHDNGFKIVNSFLTFRWAKND